MLQVNFQNQTPFRSSDIDETIEHCSQLICPHRMLVQRSDSVESSFSGFNSDAIGLISVGYGADVIIDAGDMGDFFLVQHKLSGKGMFKNGNVVTETFPGMTTVASPGLETTVEMDMHSVHVVVKLKRALVESYLQDILQRTLPEPIVFDLKMEEGGKAAQSWERTLQYLIAQYDLLQDENEEMLRKIFAETAIALLVQLQPHNYSALLKKNEFSFSPAYIRSAQEFIKTNIAEQINMTTLATATGVTARTLQNGFRRYTGQSPTEYIRATRLEKVHSELKTAPSGAKVTEILLQCGVYDFGRFAGAYKKRYGCLPSETLKFRALI